MAFFMADSFVLEDKRLFERVPIDLSMRMRDRDTNVWNLVKATDISAGGIGILSDKSLPSRTSFEMWLPIPGKGESYYTKGRIAWIKPSEPSEPNLYRAGVTFDETDLMGMSLFMRDAWRRR